MTLNMTRDYDRSEAFAKLTQEERIHFLISLAHELTIVGRDTYSPGANDLKVPARLRTINEIQHRILAWVLSTMADDSARYPKDVLFRFVLEHPQDMDLQRQVLS